MSIDIQTIIDHYCSIINTNYCIHLNNDDIINFTFKGVHLPHLLGLHYLVDVPIFEKYNNKNIKATEIFKLLKNKEIDLDEIYKSKYFEDIYQSKLKYFFIPQLLSNMKIVEFNPTLIKDYDTKLDKVEYLFWSYLKTDNGYKHLGLGFTTTNGISFPNTFFFRNDEQYIVNQKEILPLSYLIKRPDKTIEFKIFWENLRASMNKTSHYKYLKKYEDKYKYKVNELSHYIVSKIDNLDIVRHYELLRLDEVKKAYIPYMDEANRWNNQTKRYLISIIDKSVVDIKPNEIKSKINEMPH